MHLLAMPSMPSDVLEKPSFRSLRPVWRYLRPYKRQVLGALTALVITSGAVLSLGSALRYLVDEGLARGNPALLDRGFLLLIGVTLVLAAASYARFYLVAWIGERVVADLRQAVYDHLIAMPVSFFESTRTGELLSRLTADTTLLQTLVGGSISIALRNTLLFLGGLALLLLTSFKLTLYVLCMIPLVVVPILVLGRRVRQYSRNAQQKVGEISSHAEESFHAIRTIQTLSLEEYEAKRFGGHVQAALSAALERIRTRAALTAVVIGLIFGAVVMVLWIGGRDVLAGRISPGDLSAFIFYSVMVAAAIGAISEVLADIQRAAGAMERIAELLLLPTQRQSAASPWPFPSPLQGRIVFTKVGFAYPSRPDKPALEEVSFVAEPGETLALVGHSGAGKTTVFQLLLRLYDPQSGSIALDGIDTQALDLTALRSVIGVVPQDPVIFSGNAWENIRCGRLSATDEEVREAARMAAALEFLDKLPEGLNTYLGEKGVRLSGGQRQRLAIARAIVRNPRILLLDEATSALDSENELLVREALERLMPGRTTLIIAHRLATVMRADRIVLMHEGKIQAIGTHQELLESNALYARLAELQFA